MDGVVGDLHVDIQLVEGGHEGKCDGWRPSLSVASSFPKLKLVLTADKSKISR